MDELKRYYEVLELPQGASIVEVTKAYNHLKELYSRDSIVTTPLDGDLPEEQRRLILVEIEEAYEKIRQALAESGAVQRADPAEAARRPSVQAGVGGGQAKPGSPGHECGQGLLDGPGLRAARAGAGLEIYDIELATRISARHLENIEQERFHMLPEEVYIRGYLRAIARVLFLDPEKLVGDYMDRYSGWMRSRRKPG